MPTNKQQSSPMTSLALVNLMIKLSQIPEDQLQTLPHDYITFTLPDEPNNILHMISVMARCPYKIEELAVATNIQIWQKNTVKK